MLVNLLKLESLQFKWNIMNFWKLEVKIKIQEQKENNKKKFDAIINYMQNSKLIVFKKKLQSK